jgi:multiple sugar transport system permease protein
MNAPTLRARRSPASRSPTSIGRVGLQLAVAGLIVMQLFPLAVVILTGLREPVAVLRDGMFALSGLGLKNFDEIFVNHGMLQALWSSFVVATCSAGISVLASGSLVFACTQFRFRPAMPIILGFVCFRLVPPAALVMPLFVLMKYFAMNDTHLGLVLAHASLNLPFCVWLLFPFFRAIPNEIRQAAEVDGLGSFDKLWRIFLPLVLPGLMVAGIFSFLLSWNDFMMSLVLAGSAVKTAPLVVNGFMTGFGPEWGNMAAASIVILLPVFLLSFSLQKHIVGGLTDGGVKS